jgi:hypothetical protein
MLGGAERVGECGGGGDWRRFGGVCIKERGWTGMTEYKWLHSKEKEALRECGLDIHNAVGALVNSCTSSGVHYESYGRFFDAARDNLNVLYRELCVQGKYREEVNHAEYEAGVKALGDGKTQLFNAQNTMTHAGVYKDLEKKVKKCQQLTGKYSRIWTAIRVFDGKHGGRAWAQRCINNYATLPKQADMDEMRGLLAEMGRMCSDKYEQ